MKFTMHPHLPLHFDPANVEQVVRWARAHNATLTHMELSAVEEKLWQKVEASLAMSPTLNVPTAIGELLSALAIHWIVDILPSGWEPGEAEQVPYYQINFYVRPGRKAALSLAT